MVSLQCISKAVISDVDGTLDDQRKLRLFMAGDQEAKDGECARLAGMPYLILASRGKNRQLHGFAAWWKDAEQS